MIFLQEVSMRRDFGSKTWMYPMPVLIVGTYDEEGRADAMTAAWGGIHNDDTVCLCISRGHKTMGNLQARKALTISFATIGMLAACDYVGMVSANDVPDKVAAAGFTVTRSRFVDAPVINELPMCMECRLVELKDENLVARIVNVCADESVLGPDGLVDYKKLAPVAYDPVRHLYVALGDVAGKAFDDGRLLMRD